MNEQRLERALRAGPPFAVAYRPRSLRLDEAPVPGPANLRRLFLAASLAMGIAAAVVLLPRSAPVPGPSGPPATLQQLNGPIQPEPFVLSKPLLGDIERVCRQTNLADIGPSARLLLVDARGGGIAYAWFLRSNGDLMDCFIERLDPVTRALSGGTSGPHPLSIPPRTLDWADHGFNHAIGRSGVGVVSVQVGPIDGSLVTATVAHGWFAAYWGLPPDCSIDDPRVICNQLHYRAVGFDAGGAVVDSITFDFPAVQP